jgi:protein associated with RNAse G/E/RimJ/RimL family protein N-acetyltransferase
MAERTVRVVSTKYDGSPHYAYEARLVAEDGALLTLAVPRGTAMSGYRGDLRTSVPFTALFYTDERWYNCYHNHWTTPRLRIESYANVALPATFDGETVRWVDLDLDVLIRSTGSVSLVDVDEFVEHGRRFGYPADLVRRANATADALLAATRERRDPFDRDRHVRQDGGTMDVAPLDDRWRVEARALWPDRWGSTRVVSRGRLHDLDALPGFVAIEDGAFAGVATYEVADGACEVVSLDALREGSGAGTALLDAVVAAARAAGCRRLWLVTTNDNTAAMRFYQRRGWRLAALHRGAVDAARALKPEIPATGADDIALRDELEFELAL